MTINKPEVRVFRPSAQAGCPAMRIVVDPEPVDHCDKYVKLSDYEALQAECENLRKDAEHARSRLRKLDLTFARFLLGMQSAVIEAEHGKGAEAGMTWIWNGLIGPGLVPDDSETDAQAYFDREIKSIDAAMQDAIARNTR